MAKQTINIGTAPNDGTGTPLRTAFDYCNLNFTELYTAVGPSGNNIVVPGTATITGVLTAGTNSIIGTGSTQNAAANRGNLTIGGTSSAILNLSINGADTGYVIHDGANITFNNRTNGYVEFFANGLAQHRIAPFGVFSWYDGAGGTRMTLNSTGLGVGVTPSAWWSNEKALQIGSGAFFSGRTANPDVAEIGANQFINSSLQRIYIGNGYASRYQQDGGVHQWFTAPSGTAGNPISGANAFVQAMTLDASGNLLVGTTSTGGSASNSVKNVGGVFSTVNGATGSTATGVAATLFTAPNEAVFIVSAYIVGSSAPANYNAVAIVSVSGGTAAITTISSALNLTISLSGLNVRATQTSGVNQAFAYSAIRIS